MINTVNKPGKIFRDDSTISVNVFTEESNFNQIVVVNDLQYQDQIICKLLGFFSNCPNNDLLRNVICVWHFDIMKGHMPSNVDEIIHDLNLVSIKR